MPEALDNLFQLKQQQMGYAPLTQMMLGTPPQLQQETPDLGPATPTTALPGGVAPVDPIKTLEDEIRTKLAKFQEEAKTPPQAALPKALQDFDTYNEQKYQQAYGGHGILGTAGRALANLLSGYAHGGQSIRERLSEQNRKDFDAARKAAEQQIQQQRMDQLNAIQQQGQLLQSMKSDRQAKMLADQEAAKNAFEQRRLDLEEYKVKNPDLKAEMIEVSGKPALALLDARGNILDATTKKPIDPVSITALSVPKPENKTEFEAALDDEMTAFKNRTGRAPTIEEKIKLRDALTQRQANNKVPEALDELRKMNLQLLARQGSATEDDVKNAAKLVVSGQANINQALQLVGGPRSGKGPALNRAIAESGDLIVDPKARDSITNVNVGLNQLDLVDDLVQNVEKAKTSEEKAKQTLLLQGYVETITARLARANGEVGVLTEQDVNRAKGLVPGWKAANFAPDYAHKELMILRKNYELVRDATLQKYFTLNKSGERTPLVNSTQGSTKTETPNNKPKPKIEIIGIK